MTYDNFVILLARQRSGTNAIRSVLSRAPELECMPEVFSIYGLESPHEAKRAVNYFNFLQRYADGDPNRIFPGQHEKVFLSYLDFLRGFSEKPLVLVDIKSSTTQFFTEPWSRNVTVPYLFDLIVTHNLRVLNITRKNYLRYLVSNEKALSDGQFHVWKARGNGHDDTQIAIDIAYLLRELENCRQTDELIATHFANYDHFRSYEYAEIFEPGGRLADSFLSETAGWLGISSGLRSTPATNKSSYLPLASTIVNYAEVAAALKDTPFAYCLEDEPAYREAAAPQ